MQVVCYDAAGGALAAARLWWMLRLAGVARRPCSTAVMAAWLAAGLPVESGEPADARPPAGRARATTRTSCVLDHARPWPTAQAGQLLDARAAPRYRGDVEPLDRGGRACARRAQPPVCRQPGRAMAASSPPRQLREEFAAVLGRRRPAQVVHMCGSGVTACHNLLAMEHAGLHRFAPLRAVLERLGQRPARRRHRPTALTGANGAPVAARRRSTPLLFEPRHQRGAARPGFAGWKKAVDETRPAAVRP